MERTILEQQQQMDTSSNKINFLELNFDSLDECLQWVSEHIWDVETLRLPQIQALKMCLIILGNSRYLNLPSYLD